MKLKTISGGQGKAEQIQSNNHSTLFLFYDLNKTYHGYNVDSIVVRFVYLQNNFLVPKAQYRGRVNQDL